MALWLRDLKLEADADEALLVTKAAALLGLKPAALQGFRVIRRALDARRKGAAQWVYTVEFRVADEGALLQQQADNPALQQAPAAPELLLPRLQGDHRILVVGMGPAGLFAAKWLAEAGARVTLVERGRALAARIQDVERFWAEGRLDPVSNVQFGEGGAGTFSDGKLTTRVNHVWIRHILETLVEFGAQPEILVEARPHIGTDRLRKVLVRFRQHLESLGSELRFESRLTDLEFDGQGRVVAGIINDSERLPCDGLVLAPGHSARDTYRMLAAHAVALEPKGFAMGVRVEHPAELINRMQYGNGYSRSLPTADYGLRYNDKGTGRGTYSFCMCPGGEVINAASEPGGLVVNGMSHAARSADRSNSALVVTVNPADWPEPGPLGGMLYQEHWERLAYAAGGGDFHAPAQNLLDFAGRGRGPVNSSCRPSVVAAELSRVLPPFVVAGIRAALPQFERQMRGFVTADAVLIGVETRTSAPVRILRDDRGESISHPGLFPTGEGAGYAGGIMSSALDGLRIADQILQRLI